MRSLQYCSTHLHGCVNDDIAMVVIEVVAVFAGRRVEWGTKHWEEVTSAVVRPCAELPGPKVRQPTGESQPAVMVGMNYLEK